MSMGMAVVMVMLAMLVMVMMVAVVVIMVMTMARPGMIVRRMSVRCMVVGVAGRMRVAVTGIGAAFWIERRFDLDQARPQPLHHCFDHVVAPDAQATSGDLCRQVTIAEMPGDTNQMLRIAAADFHQRLRRRHDLDQPAILKHQCIASTQGDRIFEIEQKL